MWNKFFKNNKQGIKKKENNQGTTDIITNSKITDKKETYKKVMTGIDSFLCRWRIMPRQDCLTHFLLFSQGKRF